MIIENKNHVTDRLAPKEDGRRLQSFFSEKKIDEIHFGGLFLNFMEKLVTLVVENYLKARLKKI